MWDEASAPIEAEGLRRQAHLAMAEAERHWPFLAGAATRTEYDHRKAMVSDPAWTPEIHQAFDARFAAQALAQIASKHDLVWYENRSTPKVVPSGSKVDPDESWGKQTKRAPASEADEKAIANGDWVRKSEDGSQSDGTGSKIRPQFNKSSSKGDGFSKEKRGDKWVVTDTNGNTKGTHDSESAAEDQVKALYAEWRERKESAYYDATPAQSTSAAPSMGQPKTMAPASNSTYRQRPPLDMETAPADEPKTRRQREVPTMRAAALDEVTAADLLAAEAALSDADGDLAKAAEFFRNEVPEPMDPMGENLAPAPRRRTRDRLRTRTDRPEDRKRLLDTGTRVSSVHEAADHLQRALDLLNPTHLDEAIRLHYDVATDLLAGNGHEWAATPRQHPPHLVNEMGHFHSGSAVSGLRLKAENNIYGDEVADESTTPVGAAPRTTRPRVQPTPQVDRAHVLPSTPEDIDVTSPSVQLPTIQPTNYSQPTPHQFAAAKVAKVAAQVMKDNPHLAREAAFSLAEKVVARYPEMVKP